MTAVVAQLVVAVSLLLAPSLRAVLQNNPDWTTPFPAFKIAGNLYYVGSKDLASYLIATPQGHILINSSLEASVPLIRASVERLGFKFTDIKTLLISHAHWDHDAGSAAIKSATGAAYMVMDGDVSVVESGGKTDFQYANDSSTWYPPTKVDRVLHDGDTVRLGGTTLVAHRTPGHSKGCTTWTMKVQDGDKTYDVVIVGSPNVNTGYKLINNPKYPEIASDYQRTFTVLKSLPCDIFLGAHGSYFNLAAKYPRLKNTPVLPFVDPQGYHAYVSERERAFLAELAKQKGPVSSRAPAEVDTSSALAWYDTLGFRNAKDLRYVRVATGSWQQKGNGPRENRFVNGFLIGEDAASFTVFLCNVEAFTEFSWADEIGLPAPLTIVHFVRNASGPPHQQIRYDVLDFRREADDVLDRVRAVRSKPGKLLMGRPVSHRARIFAFGRAALQKGLSSIGTALIALAADIPEPQTGKVETGRLREFLQQDIGDAVLTQAEVDAGDPATSWADLLKTYATFDARFPANNRLAYARDAAATLRTMMAEDATHQSPPMTQLSPTEQAAENIYQLRYLRLPDPYWTDGASRYPVSPHDLRDGKDIATPVHRLVDLGYAAVPQLMQALDDRSFTRTMIASFNGTDLPQVMRVGDFARQILEFMSGRNFFPRRANNGALVKGSTRQQVEEWWADLQRKGERQHLIDIAAAGGGAGRNAARQLVEKYPDAAIAAIEAGIRASPEQGLRSEYVDVAGTLDGAASLGFLKSSLAPAAGRLSQIAAARALFARGAPEAVPAMIDLWRRTRTELASPTFEIYYAVGRLITFLASSGEIGAFEALEQELRTAPVDVRLAVARVFLPRAHQAGESSAGLNVHVDADLPRLPAGAPGAAIERLLLASLDDRERRRAMSGTYDDVTYVDPRVCDVAAFALALRWPEKYVFRWSANAGECDAQIERIKKRLDD